MVVGVLVAAAMAVATGAQDAHAVGSGNVLKRWVMTQAGPQTVTQAQAGDAGPGGGGDGCCEGVQGVGAGDRVVAD